MERIDRPDVSYSVFDPTGNITALVESAVPVPEQPALAAEVMRRHPDVEQVGFVRFPADADDALPELRMAGGEFCGNASMCAAALYADTFRQAGRQEPDVVALRVSGAAQPVDVFLFREGETRWAASVMLPPAKTIESVPLTWDGTCDSLPLVRMEGISHLVIEPGSPFYSLRDRPEAAGQAVREWCAVCRAPGLGLMFLERSRTEFCLTPLVYIPGSDTLFWENSCASGSAAVGMLLAGRAGSAVSMKLKEPGGRLRVDSSPGGQTRLFGNVKLIGQHTLQSM